MLNNRTKHTDQEIAAEKEEKLTFKSVMKEWVLPLGLEALVLVLLIKFVFFLSYVPTGSMLQTIPEHSWLFATRMYEPEKNVERGDILVFQNDELDKVLIKRVIGLPGDHVQLNGDGSVYVNEIKLDEPYVSSQSDYIGTFDVPEGCYLFFGDNRGGSVDARYWRNPYISEDNIMGQAHFILWPLSAFGPAE